MQVAVEICVEPKPRADRAIGVGVYRSLPAPDHPARVARLDARIHQRVACEAAPNFEVRAETRFAASDTHEIAGAASAKRSNKPGKQAGSERFSAGVDLDFRFGSYTLLLPIRLPFD